MEDTTLDREPTTRGTARGTPGPRELQRRVRRRLGRAVPERPERWGIVSVAPVVGIESSAALLSAVDVLASLGWPDPTFVGDLTNAEPRVLQRRVGRGAIVVLDRNAASIGEASDQRLGHLLSESSRNSLIVLSDVAPEPPRWAQLHTGSVTLVSDVVRSSRGHRTDGDGIATVTCPDVLFGLGPLERTADAHGCVSFLRGRDQSADDWMPGVSHPAVDAEFRLRVLGGRHRALRSVTARLREGLLLRAAAARLRSAIARLSECRVVITDRWDVHVLSVLLGTPQVLVAPPGGVLAERSGRWTARLPNVRLCADVAEAEATAVSLLNPCSGCR
ncbi:MAG: hypothetical protein AAF389_05410 [Gemmatimonadota bacterium]